MTERYAGIAGVLLLIPLAALLMFTTLLQPAPASHERSALEAALRYVATLPPDAPSFLFRDNQPQVKAVAYDAASRDALETLRASRPDRYRAAASASPRCTSPCCPAFSASRRRSVTSC